ncbi:MAG: polysaccharide biosynthesis/export family protein [Phycisphaerae bacterium]|nr:polysaccharide biosynthesis/export family protein [Phycisphaerae bacterium]
MRRWRARGQVSGGTCALRARALGAVALVAALNGCEVDSFLDPSVIGRWENTPTIVPIIERIDVIERDTGEFVDVTPVMAEDLLPEANEYRAGPGDFLTIEILDFYQAGAPARFEESVDSRGYVTLPQIGEVYVNKLSRQEIQQAIGSAIKAAGLVDNAIVEVQIPGARQATFSIFGVVARVGRYAVPGPDYRLLEALTDAGGISPSIDKVYVIRQVSLRDEELAPATKGGPAKKPAAPKPSRSGVEGEKNLIDLIQELTEPEGEPEEPAKPAVKTPSAPPPGSGDPNLESLLEPESAPPEERVPPNPGVLGSGRAGKSAVRRPAATPSMAVMRQSDDPPIDLVDQEAQPVSPIAPPSGGSNAVAGQGRWVFLNGEWRQIVQGPSSRSGGLAEGADPLKSASKENEVITQRVIEVPVGPLLQGVAQYNLVIRPGDSISVPGPKQGFIYLSGPGIGRPGVYQLPFTGKLTLQRLIASAGGLSVVAIPERVDLIRMVGDDRQATVRLNLRAIAEGTQPDIFLKPDDLVNVGTNFWATPLAVIRGGFRASYGFGFLLDRNFGNDVFGAPPDSRNF